MVTHSSILAWRIPWTEKPGRLQSTGSQRVGHDSARAQAKTDYSGQYKGPGPSALQEKIPQRQKGEKQVKCLLGGKRIRAAGHTSELRQSHPHGGTLSHLYAAFFPGFLWPIILL